MAKIKTSLRHNGPLFPKPYEYKGIYKLDGITLNPMLEKLVYKWAILGEIYRKDPMYAKNAAPTIKRWANKELKSKKFPADYMALMEQMRVDHELDKEAKKLANTKEAREIKKAETEKVKAKYGWCELDGQQQPLGNYTLEPEGWFIGRGNSPLRGLWKYEIQPEDITINYVLPGKHTKKELFAQAPQPPQGHKWKDVVENKNAYFTVIYTYNLGENGMHVGKRMGFAPTSIVKQNADIEKFDKAQKLAKDWGKIEKWIDKGLEDDKQESLIAWLILRTGIRVGHDKAEEIDNGTVGASTLLVKNVSMNGTTLRLDFLGKDSVRYMNEIDVPQIVADRITQNLNGKKPTDKIFDKASAGTVNAFLQECIPYCTAKLFRTTYGTKLLAEELQNFYKAGKFNNVPEWKVKALYDEACLTVSKKLNHQRNVAKNFAAQLDKSYEGIAKAKENAKKRKEKATEQLKKIKTDIAAAKKALKGERLKLKLAQLKERKDKIALQVERSQERIEKLEVKKRFKNDTKNIALGTAKNAYSSPKIAYSFCKDVGVDIGIVYNKSLQKKFEWAENTPKEFWRKYP